MNIVIIDFAIIGKLFLTHDAILWCDWLECTGWKWDISAPSNFISNMCFLSCASLLWLFPWMDCSLLRVPLVSARPVLDCVFPYRMFCCCCCLFLNKSLPKVGIEQSKVGCFFFLTTGDKAHLFCITDAIKFMLYIGSISYIQYSLSFGDQLILTINLPFMSIESIILYLSPIITALGAALWKLWGITSIRAQWAVFYPSASVEGTVVPAQPWS